MHRAALSSLALQGMYLFLQRLRRCNISVSVAVAATVGLTAPHAAAQIIADGQRFTPVQAREHMVVAQEAQAAMVGREILRAGGNAVDAAIATGFALAVTLPRAGNIGGGGFMVIKPADGEATTIDFRETAPASADKDMFLGPDGEADPQLSRSSGLGVGVPGTVAGFQMALDRYGSGNFTLADLVTPAIEIAEQGFVVSPRLASALRLPRIRERLDAEPEAQRMFYRDGEPPEAGEILTMPVLAQTLSRIRDEGPAGFYEGPVAEAIAATVQQLGGRMTVQDLAAYEPIERAPVTGTFKDYTIISMPPPSSGGVHLIQMLNIIEDAPFGTFGMNSAEMIHTMAEAAKYAYADRSVHLGDPDFSDIPIAELTSKDYAATIAALINPTAATPSTEIAADPGRLPTESDETTHYSVVDDNRMAVSVTYTLNFSFGVGFAAEGTGVLLNNELDDFSAKPGTPNAYGLIGGAANAVEPRKRPLSSMTPTILLKDGELFMVTGSPGGSRIITTVMQIILNATVHRRDIMTSTTAPRVHHQWLPDYIRIEEGISFDTIRLLEEKGHDVRTQRSMGATQTIVVGSDGLLYGASDPRAPGGMAAGD